MEKARIIVIEDDVVIAVEIEQSLQLMGHDVVARAYNGEDSIRLAKQHKPDIMIMDIRLQGDMDGIQAAHIIRERFNIPIVFLAAHLDQERIEQSKLTLPFGYILKPVQQRDIRVTIEMALYVGKVDAKRRQAEHELEQKASNLETVNEDLRNHQVELEQQNEELRAIQLKLSELQQKYFSLYNLAPVGYLTFNGKGLITEANLTFCSMLGLKRVTLKMLMFSSFIGHDSQDIFYHHKRQAIETNTQQSCELTLVRKDKSSFTARLESRALFSDNNEFIQMNTNIIDITKRSEV
jgi:PAS domain S-box-containing protein